MIHSPAAVKPVPAPLDGAPNAAEQSGRERQGAKEENGVESKPNPVGSIATVTANLAVGGTAGGSSSVSKDSGNTPNSEARVGRYFVRYGVEIAASSSSLCSTFISYPLDSVKTRMQAYHFPSIRACVRQTYLTEGIHGFWRGVFSPLVTTAFVRTLSFSVYQKARDTYSTAIGNLTGRSPLSDPVNDHRLIPSEWKMACVAAAGSTAGAVSAVTACPFELSKLGAQISVLMAGDNAAKVPARDTTPNTPPVSAKRVSSVIPSMVTNTVVPGQRGNWEIVKWLVRTRGVASLYSGFTYHLLRDSVGTGVYFTTYETGKQFLGNISGSGNRAPNPGVTAIAGGLCGVMGWIVVYPIDSAKSIYQKNRLSEGKDISQRPVIEYFNRHRYRGLSVSVSRSCVVNAIFFSMFEKVKREIDVLGGAAE